jgi:hypothetical protein
MKEKSKKDINRNVKIALCLYGKPTCSMFCFPYIYDAFMNNNYHVDVFIHTWNEARVIDLYKPKQVKIEQYNIDDIKKFYFDSLTLPSDLKIAGNITNNILEYHSIKECIDQVTDEYDYIIKCRFDILIEHKFNLKEIIDDLEADKYDLFSPDEVYNFGGYQNGIYMGKYDALKVAANLLLELNIMANNLKYWHPETFFKYHLDKNNIRVYQKDIGYRIVRKSTIITNWPENPYNFLDL